MPILEPSRAGLTITGKPSVSALEISFKSRIYTYSAERNIAVIFGGISNENEISVITGTMAANVLKKGGDRLYDKLFLFPAAVNVSALYRRHEGVAH